MQRAGCKVENQCLGDGGLRSVGAASASALRRRRPERRRFLEPAAAFSGQDLTEAECDAVEHILSREPKGSVISMYTLCRKVEVFLRAPEDALEVKKGAIIPPT